MNAFLGFVEGSGAVSFRTSAVVFNLNIQRCPRGQSVLAIDFALAFILEFFAALLLLWNECLHRFWWKVPEKWAVSFGTSVVVSNLDIRRCPQGQSVSPKDFFSRSACVLPLFSVTECLPKVWWKVLEQWAVSFGTRVLLYLIWTNIFSAGAIGIS